LIGIRSDLIRETVNRLAVRNRVFSFDSSLDAFFLGDEPQPSAVSLLDAVNTKAIPVFPRNGKIGAALLVVNGSVAYLGHGSVMGNHPLSDPGGIVLTED